MANDKKESKTEAGEPSPMHRTRQKAGAFAEGDDQAELQQRAVEKFEADAKERAEKIKYASGVPRANPIGNATGIDPGDRTEEGTLGAIKKEVAGMSVEEAAKAAGPEAIQEEQLRKEKVTDEPGERGEPGGKPGGKSNGDDLDGQTVEELRETAANEDVDLTGVTLKADIIAAIEKHRSSTQIRERRVKALDRVDCPALNCLYERS